MAFAENVRYLSMVTDRWKITQNRHSRDSVRIFDLEVDPEELHPLRTDDARFLEEAPGLLSRLNRFDRSQPDPAQFATATGGKLEQLQRLQTLKALGYVQALGPEVLEAIDSGNEKALEMIGDTDLVGSMHVMEESLYSWPHPWPPKPTGAADDDAGADTAPADENGEDG